MYDLLPVSWSPSGAPELRCMVYYRCVGLEVVPQHKDKRFVAGVLVSKWCPSTKINDLLPVSWSRSGAPAQKCTICCWCLGLKVVRPALRFRNYCRCLGLLPQHKDVRFVSGVLISKWCPSTKMYDLMLVSWFGSDAPAARRTRCCQCAKWCPELRCTICCRCLGLEVVPQY